MTSRSASKNSQHSVNASPFVSVDLQSRFSLEDRPPSSTDIVQGDSPLSQATPMLPADLSPERRSRSNSATSSATSCNAVLDEQRQQPSSARSTPRPRRTTFSDFGSLVMEEQMQQARSVRSSPM